MSNTYPDRLLPAPDAEIIEDINPEHLIVRWFRTADPSIVVTKDDLEVAALIQRNKFPGLSVNKSPESRPEDVQIQFINNEDYYNREWTKGDSPARIEEDDFIISEERKFFAAKIELLHNQKGEYKYRPPKRETQNLIFYLYIIHKPTISNYWHFEFDIRDNNFDTLDYQGRGWQREIISKIRVWLDKAIQFTSDDR